MKTKTIAKGKCLGSPARQRDSLVFKLVNMFSSLPDLTYPESLGRLYQNIFPLANTFAKRENVRPGQPPTGTQMRSINTFLVVFGSVIEYPQLEYM